ncbi:MAG: lytic murein transglycosylase B [Limnobacter sp.]|nr:lytic murein transglycosylase B [Limnobacter sp.]
MAIFCRNFVAGLFAVFAAWFCVLHSAHAEGNYDQRAKAMELAQQLQAQHNIPVARTLALLKEARYLPHVVKAVKPPNKPGVRDWDRYRSRFVEKFRIEKGIEFWNDNETALNQASQQFGVPPEVIVAIIGVETIYGRHLGKNRVLDSLATLAFDYPTGQRDRSEFFTQELAAFIVLTENSHLDALQVEGSYAGAVGLGQFMPSSWQAYAVDGDGNGIIDLFGSKTDAIFSVANFLKVHGWEPGVSALIPVEIKQDRHLSTLLAPDIVPTFTPQEMVQQGLELKHQTLENEKLALIELVRSTGPSDYVVGGNNFYVVTRYNRSSFYATAVLELAQALRTNRELSMHQTSGVDPV